MDEFKLLFEAGDHWIYSYARQFEGEFLVFDKNTKTIVRLYGEGQLLEFLGRAYEK